jgi:chaperonin cofactor prefoldin
MPADDYGGHTKRLMDLYDNKANSFDKYFAILVGVSLFVLFFLLFPYVITQQLEYDLSKKIEKTTQNLTLYERKTNIYKNVSSVLDNLTRQADIFPKELAIYIHNVANSQSNFIDANATLPSANVSIQQSVNYTSKFDKCTEAYEITKNRSRFLECNVNQKILIEITGLNQSLITEVILPLSSLDNQSQSQIGVSELKDEVPKVRESLYLLVYKYRSSWNTTDYDVISSPVADLVKRFLEKYNKRVETELLKLIPVVTNLNENVTQLKKELAGLKDDRKNITKRITEFESPIGKLTAGFDDLVLVFPIAIVCTFVVCSSFLTQTFRFRRECLNSYPANDQNNHAINLGRSAIAAPLWIDKTSGFSAHNVGRFLVLLIPVVIFIASLSLINYSWNIPGTTFGYNEDYRNVYRVLYGVLGVSLFLYSYLKIIYEARQ